MTTPCGYCGNPVPKSSTFALYRRSSTGELDQKTKPVYAHPGCLAPKEAAKRRACDHGHAGVGRLCRACGLRIIQGRREVMA